MDDLISRRAAIDAIGNVPDYDDGMVWEALSHAQRDVALLPSVQPERKNGKWHQRFYSQIEMMVCSECNSEFSYDAETGVRDYNFCPNCGADMRERKES